MTAIFGTRPTETPQLHHKTPNNADLRPICEQGTRPIVKIDGAMALA